MKYVLMMGVLLFPFSGQGQDPQGGHGPKDPHQGKRPQPQKQDGKSAQVKARLPKDSVTDHKVTINGKAIPYQATAGTLTLKEDDGKPTANMFYMAYTKKGVTPGTRPVTFSLDGGPGSSSVWLHLGVLGPKIIKLDDEGHAPGPPFGLKDNAHSILDKTDLVFIDPVSTGYSRAVKGVSPKKFHGYREDIASVGEFIRLYVTRHNLWQSPKYLIGESYGTIRASGLAGHLARRHGMYLNGVILVSAVLNFGTVSRRSGNDWPYLLYLPTYTATAYHHKKLPADLLERPLPEVLKEVEAWAKKEYLVTLAKGDALTEAEQNKTADLLSRYTGLSPIFIKQSRLRVSMGRFAKELLRNESRTVGRFDSRYKGIDKDDAGSQYDYDPSYTALYGVFSDALRHYVRKDLGFVTDMNYEILSRKVHPWNYKEFTNQYLEVSTTLRDALVKNEKLKLLVLSGYTDLATPYFATDHVLAHLGLPKVRRDNITVKYYEAGHMMYVRKKCLIKMKADLDDFFDREAAALN